MQNQEIIYDHIWLDTDVRMPPFDTIVETKIEDKYGKRNLAHLRRINDLWYVPDRSRYVGYVPTHWRYDRNVKNLF